MCQGITTIIAIFEEKLMMFNVLYCIFKKHQAHVQSSNQDFHQLVLSFISNEMHIQSNLHKTIDWTYALCYLMFQNVFPVEIK